MIGAALLTAYLLWAAQAVDWLHMPGQALMRVGLVAATIAGAALLYLAAVALLGLNLRQFLRR
jgi:putative peptidoglycan lipid II flippase